MCTAISTKDNIFVHGPPTYVLLKNVLISSTLSNHQSFCLIHSYCLITLSVLSSSSIYPLFHSHTMSNLFSTRDKKASKDVVAKDSTRKKETLKASGEHKRGNVIKWG